MTKASSHVAATGTEYAPHALLTTRAVQRDLGISHTKLYELLRDGALKRVKVGRATRIPASSLYAYLARIGAA